MRMTLRMGTITMCHETVSTGVPSAVAFATAALRLGSGLLLASFGSFGFACCLAFVLPPPFIDAVVPLCGFDAPAPALLPLELTKTHLVNHLVKICGDGPATAPQHPPRWYLVPHGWLGTTSVPLPSTAFQIDPWPPIKRCLQGEPIKRCLHHRPRGTDQEMPSPSTWNEAGSSRSHFQINNGSPSPDPIS